MKDLLSVVGITKQALWKYQKRQEQKREWIDVSLKIMRRYRKGHGGMGCRSIYNATKEKPPVGRDRFISIGMENGFRLKRRRNKRRTTWSQSALVFANCIEGRTLNRTNQVWQSDIFYHEENGKSYYGITIIDVYSRRLVSLHLSRSLRAIENVKALKKAIQTRNGQNLVDCILHSDLGSQYISQMHRSLVAQHGMIQSMCKIPQENAYAERVQHTIKNSYLCYEILEGRDLNKVAQQIMRKYNCEKPHSQLNNMNPVAFEKYVENLPLKARPKELIYKWDHSLSTKSELPTKRKR